MTEQELNKACEIVRDLANEHFGDWEQSCKFEDKFRKAMSTKTNPLFEQCLSDVNPETRAEVRGNMEFLDKAVEWLNNTLPNIEYITNASALRQNKKQFINAFRNAMAVKESLTTELKKKMIIEWDDKGSVDISVPEGEAKTVEVVGILEMCKLVLFENRQQKED